MRQPDKSLFSSLSSLKICLAQYALFLAIALAELIISGVLFKQSHQTNYFPKNKCNPIFEFAQKSIIIIDSKCINERITTYLALVLLAILQEYKITTTLIPTQHSRKGHSKTTKNIHHR